MERFSFLLRGKKIQINKVGLFLNFKEAKYYTDYPKGQQPLAFSLELGNTSKNESLNSDPSLNGMPAATIFGFETNIPGSLTLTVKEDSVKSIAQSLQRPVGSHTRMNTDAFGDLFIVCWYSATE